MTYWKQILGRLALSTASLTIIATLGGLLGAILGAVLELMLQAIVGLAVSPLTVIPLFMVLGLAVGLVWGLSVLVQHRTQAPVQTRYPH
jgi:hypothetical protein